MDEQIRDLERRLQADPDDKELRISLAKAWNRANIVPTTASGLALLQAEWRVRHQTLREELTSHRQRFIQFLEQVFKEHPKLELVVFLSYVPGFMDGDPLHPGWSILVSPRDFAQHDIAPYDEIFEFSWDSQEDTSKLRKEGEESLKIRPGSINGELSASEAETIGDQFVQFSEYMCYMFGTNTRVNFTRDPEPHNEEHHWKPRGVIWERQEYNCGY